MDAETVERVNHHGRARQARRQPAQEATLGRVGVHDREPLPAHQPDQPPQHQSVAGAKNLAEARHLLAPQPSLASTCPQVAAGTTGDPHIEPFRVGPEGREQRVAAGTGPEPGDHVQHLDPVRCRLLRQLGTVDDNGRGRRPGTRHGVAISAIARSAVTIAASPSATDVHGW